jgi:hypothetical protein
VFDLLFDAREALGPVCGCAIFDAPSLHREPTKVRQAALEVALARDWHPFMQIDLTDSRQGLKKAGCPRMFSRWRRSTSRLRIRGPARFAPIIHL